MRRLFVSLLVLAFAMVVFSPQAEALYGLKKWYLSVQDEYGYAVDDSTVTVNVYTVDTTTNATIYSDDKATAKTNPWDITDGYIEFWSATSTLDIQVNVGSRGAMLEDATTVSTHRITLPQEAVTIQKTLLFTPQMFIDATTGETIDAGEAPGLSIDNLLVDLDWADGETDKAQVTFRVPYDYLTGGYFRAWADESTSFPAAGTSASYAAIDFEVLINADTTAFDAALTNQTPVALAGNAGSPEELTLTVVTDFASLAAGQLVTLNIWRENTLYTGTPNLEIYYVEFVYTAKE